MKTFLILNVDFEVTRYFSCNDMAHASLKCRQLNYSQQNSIVCSLIDGWYEPTLRPTCERLTCFEAYAQINSYLSKYLLALSCLPGNFPPIYRMRKNAN